VVDAMGAGKGADLNNDGLVPLPSPAPRPRALLRSPGRHGHGGGGRRGCS
jgi:hypothetical protein